MKDDFKQSLNQAKLLMLNKKHSAFITSMLYNFEIVPTVNVDKLFIQDGKLSVNPDWFNELDVELQATALAHATLHYSLEHDLRQGMRNPEIYQIACDQVVDNLLDQMGYDLSEDEQNFIHYGYRNMAVESVYKYVEEEINKRTSRNPDYTPDKSSLGDDVGKSNATDKQRNDRKKQVFNAYTADKMLSKNGVGIGSISEELDRIIFSLKDGKLPWAIILRNYIDMCLQPSITYRVFNRRYLPMDLYLPSRDENSSVGRIAVSVDLSSSVSQKEVDEFISEVNLLKKDIEPEQLEIATFNSELIDVITLGSEDKVSKIKLYGSGGTDVIPVFEHFSEPENIPAFLIIFTDLGICDFPETPEYPVIWVCSMPRDTIQEPPFGKVIYI